MSFSFWIQYFGGCLWIVTKLQHCPPTRVPGNPSMEPPEHGSQFLSFLQPALLIIPSWIFVIPKLFDWLTLHSHAIWRSFLTSQYRWRRRVSTNDIDCWWQLGCQLSKYSNTGQHDEHRRIKQISLCLRALHLHANIPKRRLNRSLWIQLYNATIITHKVYGSGRPQDLPTFYLHSSDSNLMSGVRWWTAPCMVSLAAAVTKFANVIPT